MTVLNEHLQSMQNEIECATLSQKSEEVAFMLAGYIAKKVCKRFKCNECKSIMTASEDDKLEHRYIQLIDRGGLTYPSAILASYVCHSFAIFDIVHDTLLKYAAHKVRHAGEQILLQYNRHYDCNCSNHLDLGRKFVNRIITNIFLNNEQKLDNAAKRKDDVKTFKSRHLQKV